MVEVIEIRLEIKSNFYNLSHEHGHPYNVIQFYTYSSIEIRVCKFKLNNGKFVYAYLLIEDLFNF